MFTLSKFWPGDSGAPPAVLLLDETGLGSAYAAYSVRKLRAAYAGNCLRVRRASDSTEQNIGFVSDEIDSSAIATFCSGTDGFVARWFDQSGNGNDISNATAANQPIIASAGVVITGANGKTAMEFDGSNDALFFTGGSLVIPENTFSVVKQITWVSGRFIFGSGASSSQRCYQNSSSPALKRIAQFASGENTDLAVGAWGILINQFSNNAADSMQINNGTPVTANCGTGSCANVNLAANNTTTPAGHGNVAYQEHVVYGSIKDTTETTTARNNQNAYYSIF